MDNGQSNGYFARLGQEVMMILLMLLVKIEYFVRAASANLPLAERGSPQYLHST
jgi:hypothetical protein